MPFIADVVSGPQKVIITDYSRDSFSLQYLRESSGSSNELDLLSLRDGLRIFFEMTAALGYLRTHNIMHRSIRPHVILVDPLREPVHAQLTGFSEWRTIELNVHGVAGLPEYRAPEMRENEQYGPQVDVYSLSAVTQEFFPPTGKDAPMLDTDYKRLITCGMSKSPGDRPEPFYVHDTIKNFIGGSDFTGGPDVSWTPFRQVLASRRYTINIVDAEFESDPVALDAGQLLELLRAYDQDKCRSEKIKPLTNLFNKKKRSTSEQPTPISCRLAAKVCHNLGFREWSEELMQATTERRKEPFNWDCPFKISYHAPSLMVNINQIGSQVQGFDISIQGAKCIQHVVGYPDMEGIYVDQLFFRKTCATLQNQKICEIEVPELTPCHNPLLRQRFEQVQYPEYRILATKLVNPNMILVRSHDSALHQPSLVGAEDAWGSMSAMQSDVFIPWQKALGDSSNGLDEKLAHLLHYLHGETTEVDSSSTVVRSTASRKTSQSFLRLEREIIQEDELKFTFKARSSGRKRVRSNLGDDNDVALDGNRPLDRGPTVPTNVESWLEQINSNSRRCKSSAIS